MARTAPLLIALALGACAHAMSTEPPPPAVVAAQFVEHEAFPSAFVQPRNVTVWLPPDYRADANQRYPVIYAHDGQNLFDASLSYGGVEWGIDETAERLMTNGSVRAAIIVGIWNTDRRWQEYAPQKAIQLLSGDTSSDWLGPTLPKLEADNYLRFVTEELKPYVDRNYATEPDAANTMIMGSSMGGLISLYALGEHPDIFSRAAAVSVHWPLADPGSAISAQADTVMQAYLANSGIDPIKHMIWFDRGTETLDASYGPHAVAMEAWFRGAGWTEDRAAFNTFPDTDHSEGAWASRTDQILGFLLAE